MDTVTPGYPPPNLRATPLLSSWEKLLVVRCPDPDLPPIGLEEPLPPSSEVHPHSEPSLTPHEGDRNHAGAQRRAVLLGWMWGH